MPTANRILNREDEIKVVAAIKRAELNTSGEIKVHIESHCKGDIAMRSTALFHKLKMDKTAARNGVLIYLAFKDKRFAILGDQGINEVVEANFWEDVKDLMSGYFKQGDFAEGLEKGILACGEKLKAYFPYQSDDINEISDEISYE